MQLYASYRHLKENVVLMMNRCTLTYHFIAPACVTSLAVTD